MADYNPQYFSKNRYLETSVRLLFSAVLLAAVGILAGYFFPAALGYKWGAIFGAVIGCLHALGESCFQRMSRWLKSNNPYKRFAIDICLGIVILGAMGCFAGLAIGHMVPKMGLAVGAIWGASIGGGIGCLNTIYGKCKLWFVKKLMNKPVLKSIIGALVRMTVGVGMGVCAGYFIPAISLKFGVIMGAAIGATTYLIDRIVNGISKLAQKESKITEEKINTDLKNQKIGSEHTYNPNNSVSIKGDSRSLSNKTVSSPKTGDGVSKPNQL